MIKLLVPKFDKDLNFVGHSKVCVKNKIDTKDYNKIASVLPGLPQGYCEEIYSIGKTKKPIEITRFYDPRQRDISKIKNRFITVI
jgi:hypothetical protein